MLYEKVSAMEQENTKLKERVRYLEEELWENPTDKPYHCRECVHFYQHYIRYGTGYFSVDAGHCGAGRRIKKTTAESEVCRYFEAKKSLHRK